ncbi:MAG: glycosyltransferase family 4 protein [Terriglobales bacterium]
MSAPVALPVFPAPSSTTVQEPEAAIRVLALVEADTVHGPAKNLLEYCRTSQEVPSPHAIHVLLAPFERSQSNSFPAAQEPNEFVQEATRLGIAIHPIQEDFRFDPRMIERLRTLVDRVNPHVIQSHHAKSHFLVRVSGIWKSRPWVAFHHGHTRSLFRLRIYQALDRWSLRAPARVVAVSHAFAQQLGDFGINPGKIAVVHNAVRLSGTGRRLNPVQLRQQKAALGLNPESRTVLAIGRLSKEKAFPDLIRALARLRGLHPEMPLQLVIVGEGSERLTVEAAIRSAGIGDLATLTGHARDVSPFYEMADVMAISSTSEGSPNVLLEAMAAGVPVVATAVGGIPEIVTHHQHALLVPPNDPEAMARGLGLVLSDAVLANELAAAARRLVAEKYSPEQRAQSLRDLYVKVYQSWKWPQPSPSAQAGRA